jgi:glycosyltransferase involved in cell wall biosynthesis
MSTEFTIAIPTYNGAPYIKEALTSIFSQSLQNFDLVISDDCSTDNTLKVISHFKNRRLKVYQNNKNLGYGKNLQVLRKKIKTNIVFLMGQDDILLKHALKKTILPLLKHPGVGIVTRPFYWFDNHINKPVRTITPYNLNKTEVRYILDNKRVIKKFFESTAQLSGIAFKNNLAKVDFHPDIFTAHVYPLAYISKKAKICFVKDYTVAVRIYSSQTRNVSKIYQKSPLQSWVEMVNIIYPENKFLLVKKVRIKQISSHYLGLLQIKNFATYKQLLREIFIHVKYYPLSLLRPDFWIIGLAVLIVPKKIVLWLTDNFKNKIMAKFLKNLNK